MIDRSTKFKWLHEKIARFGSDARGGIAVIFGVAAPVLIGAVLVSVELGQIMKNRSSLQAMADSAALAGAREMRLGNATEKVILSVAKSMVDAQSSNFSLPVRFSGSVPRGKNYVRVRLRSVLNPSLAGAMGLAPSVVTATARARVLGGSPVCVVALRESLLPGISLDIEAKMQARGCAIYSNSDSKSSIIANLNSSLTAAMICAGGGIGIGTGTISPTPTTDCPKIPDPLANRSPPPVSPCSAANTGLVISRESRTLVPGTYCGGLTITKDSTVTLSSGVYVIKDGPLIVGGKSSLKGVNVGFYFTGVNAVLDFQRKSTISLTAPKSGPMAGMLMYQDRNILDAQPIVKGGPSLTAGLVTKGLTPITNPLKYEVSSDNAAVLLGTIYLPKGLFYSGGSQPIAQNSAYTIIVAYQINAEAGPTLVLNSNYSLSDIPIPDGVGPLSNKIQLEK